MILQTSGSKIPGYKYQIDINPVKIPMPTCYGHRCNFDDGCCIACTVYTACAYHTKMYLELIRTNDWPEAKPL